MTRREIESEFNNNIDFDKLIDYNETDKKITILRSQNIKRLNSKLIIKNINFDKLHICGFEYIYEKFSSQNMKNQLPRINNIIFEQCNFRKSFKISKSLVRNIIFKNCKFTKVSLHNIQDYTNDNTGSIHFSNSNNRSSNQNNLINDLSIHHCIFNGKLYINDQKNTKKEFKINSVIIKDSVFNKNFKLHNCKVKTIKLDGVDFIGNADFYKSKFGIEEKGFFKKIFSSTEPIKDILFKGINFDKLVIFEECAFYNKFTMEYSTFESLGQFRNATFKQGLDLDRTNILKNLNFYGIKDLDNKKYKYKTSQETYKIIKYHSKNNGSVIEENKYNALELEQKRKNLSIKNFGDWLIFNINHKSSRFGTNLFLPLFWILTLGVYTAYVINWEFVTIEKILEIPTLSYLYSSQYLDDLHEGLNISFKYMSIIRLKDFENSNIMFFFNKVLLGYLYYQFVTAVRKDTRN